MHAFTHLPMASALGVALGAAAPVAAQNAIVNGDFESGNTGFASDYTFGDDTVPEGTYCIADDPVVCSPLAADFHDHTTGHGNMMVVNGATARRTLVWEERVTVTPSTTYLFVGWAASWGHEAGHHVDPSPGSLRMRAGFKLGHIKVDPHNGVWKRFEFPWRSGPTQTSTTITIVDGNLAAMGNDFALDDLSFTPVKAP